MEYQLLEWRDEDLVRLDIKINGEDAPPLSTVCHRDQAYARGKSELLIEACAGFRPVPVSCGLFSSYFLQVIKLSAGISLVAILLCSHEKYRTHTWCWYDVQHRGGYGVWGGRITGILRSNVYPLGRPSPVFYLCKLLGMSGIRSSAESYSITPVYKLSCKLV